MFSAETLGCEMSPRLTQPDSPPRHSGRVVPSEGTGAAGAVRLNPASGRSVPAEFEVNVVVLLQGDHLITENFPLKLCRV